MDYFFDRNTSIVCVRMDAGYYSQMDKVQDLLMPETMRADGVNYNAAGMVSLSEYLSGTTEKDVLYCIYFILKSVSEWKEKADARLALILDPETVFYDKRKNRFCFAVRYLNGEDLNPIAFISDLVFRAVFKDKDLQTAIELINFIRASIHTSERDVLLFIEMSQYGRGYMSDWTKFKKSFDGAKSSETSNGLTKNKNKSFNSVNNPTDFSDFLSTEDLFSDSQPDFAEEEEHNSFNAIEEEPANIYSSEQDVSGDYFSADSFVTEEEPDDFVGAVRLESSEGETEDMLHYSPAQSECFAEESDDELYIDTPYVEPLHAEMPYVEPSSFVNEVSNDGTPYGNAPYEEYEPEGLTEYGESEEETVGDDQETEFAPIQVEQSAEPVKTACLVDENGNKTNVSKDYFVIGRNSKESDMSIRDSSMSRKHAAIIKEGNDFYVEDLNSLNKTYLNGEQILPLNKAVLANGDCIMVSRNKLWIYIM